MSSLRIPLPWRGAQGNELHTQKGYVLTDGAHKGWYLPEIFNVRQFTDATEFFTTLASEKAQLARPSPRAQCALFDVEDFIGVATGSAQLSLRGPVIRRDTPDDGGRRMAARAADWIIRHQDEAGHVTPIVHALRDRAPTADWPRQAFATWALAAWARVTGEEAYRSAALRSHRATRGSVVGAARTAASDLVHAYLGKAALELGEAEAARASLTHLQPLILRDPITTAHVLGLARLLSAADYAASPAPALEATLMAQFRNDRSQPDTELALHAELGALLLDATPEDAGEVLAWMAGMQRKDGSFPRAARSLLRYTRGTGKVFEVLALDPEHYRASIVSCLAWLSSMQYAEDNLFFVPIERRPKLAGGFRHDDNNPDAWVDAAAHVILGVSRLIAGGRNTA